jgi:hypothetical protein
MEAAGKTLGELATSGPWGVVELAPDLGNATATAILGWYAWHTAARTIPHLVQASREEMASVRADHRAENEAMREEMAAERVQRRSDHMLMVEALRDLTEQLRE